MTAEFRSGDFLGATGVIDGLPRSTYARASIASDIQVISKTEFFDLYNRHPEICKLMNVMLCLQLRFMNEMRAEANSLTLVQRLARVIHRMSYSHAVQEDGQPPRLALSHEELASLLGASRQSIGIALKKLEDQGCIALQYGGIVINHIDELSKHYEHLLGQEQLAVVYPTSSVDN